MIFYKLINGNVYNRKAEHKEELAATTEMIESVEGSLGKNTTKKKTKSQSKKKTKETSFQCDLCPRTFIHKNSLVYHRRGHTGDRPHVCSICKKAFFAASALKVRYNYS